MAIGIGNFDTLELPPTSKRTILNVCLLVGGSSNVSNSYNYI